VHDDDRSLVFMVPGSLTTRTGGYEYDRRTIAGLRARGWLVAVRELDASFPYPTPAALDDAARALAAVDDGTSVLIDGLALGAMPDQIEREASRLRIVALVHLPLAEEIGITEDVAVRRAAAERRALSSASFVIVTGKLVTRVIATYGVPSDLIAVVEPGTDRSPLARGSRDGCPQLLCVATVNQGKGYDILINALAAVPHRNWRLTCAGSVDRYPSTVQRLRSMLSDCGLEERVSFAGELDATRLAACYDTADVFVLATLHETYGMAVTEALSRGLPIVGTATGAIPDLVGEDAGLIVPPGDTAALATALSRMIGEPHLRARLAAGARRVRDRLPTWDDASDRMVAVLERALADG
jgi:glycosyltransferase involved in cell wall biosynthesis